MSADIDPLLLAAAFGRVLRDRRLLAKLTQEALAFESGLGRNYISLLELGQNQPTIGTLFRLAAVLKVTPEALIVETGKRVDLLEK